MAFFQSFILLLLLAPFLQATETMAEAPQVVEREHRFRGEDADFSYRSLAGEYALPAADGSERARVFFTAYLRDDPKADRPLTLAFNGGPGSSSVWLHMGALGPRLAPFDSVGLPLEKPWASLPNPESWLAFSDLVFIDPVGTGYSRPQGETPREEFHGVQEDLESVAQFIHLWITRNGAWDRRIFLAGESYGTTRAVGLADLLQRQYGLFPEGLVLISSVLDFKTLRFHEGNDLPYALFLPSYAATAWYHGRLDTELQEQSIDQLTDRARSFVSQYYLPALFSGRALFPGKQYDGLIDEVSRMIGLPEEHIRRQRLRPQIFRYTSDLLRGEEGVTVGRLDSRFKGWNSDGAVESNDYDPSYAAILGVFSHALNSHLRANLGVESDTPYEILTGRVHPWNWGSASQGYPNLGPDLRHAMTRDPQLKVFIANGYYDLATPFFATEYTVNHLGLPAELQENIQMEYYEAGHMMYIHEPSRSKLFRDAKAWYTR